MSRNRVRRCFEARFTATRMAQDYLAAYETLLSGTVRQGAGDIGGCIGRVHRRRVLLTASFLFVAKMIL